MRNTLPLLSRPAPTATATPPQPPTSQPIPTIRLITATPSTTGVPSEASTSATLSADSSWASVPSLPTPLAPRSASPRKRLVPKKSKLSLLGVGSSNTNNTSKSQSKDRSKDLSDVVRRIGMQGSASASTKGFEIYVDPTNDPDIGEIVMVKKKKSRAALDGMRWGALGEVTNVPSVSVGSGEKDQGLLKVKTEENKWWSIGRGRKDSKEKVKEAKEAKEAKDAKSKTHAKSLAPAPEPPKPAPEAGTNKFSRSKTPEPLKPSLERTRFNSLDSGILLNTPTSTTFLAPAPPNNTNAPQTLHIHVPPPQASAPAEPSPPLTYSRAGTPMSGGLLAPPPGNGNGNQGSIALRAMRSVRSLARIGSWAQLRGADDKEGGEVKSISKAKGVPKVEAGSKVKKEKEGVAGDAGVAVENGKGEEKKKKKGKKKDKEKTSEKEKEKDKAKDAAQTVRISTSSFEVGALTASPEPSSKIAASKEGTKTLGRKKHSILGLGLGLGLPSTMSKGMGIGAGSKSMRVQSGRSGSGTSSIGPPVSLYNGSGGNRLSVESGIMKMGRDRAGSTMSTASSLRPMSTTSSTSRASSGSVCSGASGSGSAASVRWDEEGLESAREKRRREREAESRREREKEGKKGSKKEKGKERESRRTSEGRRRTPLSEVFPETHGQQVQEERYEYPIVTVEEATSDGHGPPDDDYGSVGGGDGGGTPLETPVKKARRRPVSEQLLGRSRPRGMYETQEGGDGVISLLDAATNDLAQLINHLDLEATPGTPDISPYRPSAFKQDFGSGTGSGADTGPPSYEGSPSKKKGSTLLSESPLKKGLRASMASISSLRPYAQSRSGSASKPTTTTSAMDLIGQQIAPWPTLNKSLSPLKEAATATVKMATTTPPPTFRLTHKRTMTPAPAADPSPVFQPLRPAKSRHAITMVTPSPAVSTASSQHLDYPTIRAPSSLTFGSRSSSRAGSQASFDGIEGGDGSPTPSPVFKRQGHGHARKRSSLIPAESGGNNKGSKDSQGSVRRSHHSASMPIPPEAKRVLGMAGTMGGSVASGYAVPELDASDPDSDIPDELQFILSGCSDHSDVDDADTLSYRLESVSVAVPSIGRSYSHPPSPGLPPVVPLPSPTSTTPTVTNAPILDLPPVFRAHLIDDDENHADIDEAGNSSSDDDTKKSFDFTGELKKLNESGGSDRRSFVEQLENAFRTPAKIDLRYEFGAGGGEGGGLLQVEVPPVPKLPQIFGGVVKVVVEDESSESSSFDSYSASRIVDVKEPTFLGSTESSSNSSGNGGSNSGSFGSSGYSSADRIVDVKEPTLLMGSDSLASIDESDDLMMDMEDSPRALRNTSSMGSRPSDGQLNTDFKFGGRPRAPKPRSEPKEETHEKPLTLSDIIPPPSHARSLSTSSMMEDDSVLNSIFAKASDIPGPRVRLDSDSSSKRLVRDFSRANTSVVGMHSRTHSRRSSVISFAGFESFEEVRRGFEFNDNRPAFYPPPGAAPRVIHGRHESLFSIASVSSYGRVVNPGSSDPFDYGLPSLRERPSSEDMSMSMSMTVDDTFSFLNHQPQRRRADSDASSFYFKAPGTSHMIQPYSRGHRRHESNMSVSSQAPPISLYNRSFGTHRRSDSNTSASSLAHSYAMFGANGGRAAWARHRQDESVDSVMSDFSAMRLGRPGIGDKMFETAEQGMPLTSISASPPESVAPRRFGGHPGDRSSFDSILDDERRTSMDDSLFDKTGHRTSMSSDSVFGYDESHPPQGHLLPPGQFRPLSSLSIHSVHSPMKEDDTMISMLGGGHVRRRSVGSIIEASPCVRVEKRRHSMFQGVQPLKGYDNGYHDSPNKARIIEKPSIASTSSYKFGGERMIKAQRGLLNRQSLEDSCLIADGEDLTTSFHAIPVFSRPGPATRSRSSTCTSSSGGDTPPLSSSDGSSISEGSQSSIDLSHINMILSNATHPVTSTARARARARARGNGHRRRASQARASRSSVYETIEEEMSASPSPVRPTLAKKDSPTIREPVFIVEPESVSMNSTPIESIWDDERGIVALRKYYALRDEAEDTVTESKRMWVDTPFSVFAVQSFYPPTHPAGMQALLEHSVQNYGPLPSELRPRRIRSRTQSRPSPYPQARTIKASISPDQPKSSTTDLRRSLKAPPLQQIPVNTNMASPAPALEVLKPFSPLALGVEPKRENAFGLAPDARPRVGSTARRTALGWSKRSTGKSSTDQKENVGQGTIMTPGESLRINRPRPRGRPTPASARQIRV